MSLHKYNSSVADQILQVISIEKEINHYRLRKLVKDDFKKHNPPYNPSNAQFEATIHELMNRKLISKNETKNESGGKRSLFCQTEIEEIRNRLGYGIEEYLKIYKICQMISVFAVLGINKVKRINHHHAYAIKVRGISEEDITERRYIDDQTNFELHKFTKEELHEYFSILKAKWIIQVWDVKENEIRYIISQKYRKFLLDVWVYLYSAIIGKISNKWRYVDRPSPEEIRWYEMIYGKEAAKKCIIECYEIRNEIKERKLEEHEKSIIQNKSNNAEIIKKFESISRKYHALNNDLYGFRDVVISIVCPSELLT